MHTSPVGYTKTMMNTKNLVNEIAHHYAPESGYFVHEFYSHNGMTWVVFEWPDGWRDEQPIECVQIFHGQYIGLPRYKSALD